MKKFEEVQVGIKEVGAFSEKLGEILQYLLNETKVIREEASKENDARKAEIEKRCGDLSKKMEEDSTTIKDIIKRQNEERKMEVKDIEAFVKNENAERKKDINSINEQLQNENQKRLEEDKALKAKLEREKKELQAYVEKDSRETKAKMEEENKALKEKLDKEAAQLKQKMLDADEEKAEEMRIMQDRLANERKMLSEKMERESAELAEEMARAETERKKEAAAIKTKMEDDKKQQDNSIVTMFDRLKGENESRKMEIHGLKDILVRENEKLTQEQMALGQKIDNGLAVLDDKINTESDDCKNKLKHGMDEVNDMMKSDKKEIKEKIENDYTDLKRKVELESNDLRDKIQFDRKAMLLKLEELEDERQKEAKLIRSQMQREREETRDSMNSETKMIQDQMDNNTKDITDMIRKEKSDREREIEVTRRRIEDEKAEMKLTLDRDRDNLTKKLNEEHDQRRIEQMEVQQRLEKTEKSGKDDMVELFHKVKRLEDEARQDNDDVRNVLNKTVGQLEEKIVREKMELRDILEHETADMNRRLDKTNVERMNDNVDIQSKVSMLDKSASRHIEHLKHSLSREAEVLLELITKPCSVVFNAFRDDGHSTGGECYVTFTGCTVNMGNSFTPKSGLFNCTEPGLYMFTLTVCTYDGKKCLLSIRKNDTDVTALIDQDGDENRGKTMITQNCMLDLELNDKVQVYAYTGAGITDTKVAHYTQFVGMLLRPSPDTVAAIRGAGKADLENDISVNEGSLRGFTPAPTRKPSVKNRVMSPPPTPQLMSPPPTPQLGTSTIREERPTRNEVAPVEEKEIHNSVPKVAPPPPEATVAEVVNDNGTLDEKSQQSYLALTKLGSGKKDSGESKNATSKAPSTPKLDSKTPASPKVAATASKEKGKWGFLHSKQ